MLPAMRCDTVRWEKERGLTNAAPPIRYKRYCFSVTAQRVYDSLADEVIVAIHCKSRARAWIRAD